MDKQNGNKTVSNAELWRLEQAQRLIVSTVVFPAFHDMERRYPDQSRLDKVWASVREAELELAGGLHVDQIALAQGMTVDRPGTGMTVDRRPGAGGMYIPERPTMSFAARFRLRKSRAAAAEKLRLEKARARDAARNKSKEVK